MIGEVLGSYRVVAKLGEGGMGTVYAAEHVVLGRRAAVKLLLPSLSSNRELVQRFFNEARATARLDHPGLVQVFDFGQTGDSSAFIVMELLSGETVAKRMARAGRLDYASAAGYCRQAAVAVGAAHAVGIVHRDLKPDNLFLVRDAEIAMGERVKVLDFGIAKLTEHGGPVSSMTRTGAVLGTPWYMSPEQCRGAGEVDLRSDIYSLGCILFEMVCGRPPFIGAGTGEIIGAHIYQERPSPRAFDPAIPEPLETILARSLAKDPAARFQSMQELGAELEQFVAWVQGGARAPLPAGGGWAPTAPGVGLATGPGFAAAAAGVPAAHGGFVAGPTTLGAASGQGAITAARPRRWLVPVVIAGTLVVAGGGVAVGVLAGRSSSTTTTSVAAVQPGSAKPPDPTPQPVKPPEPKPELVTPAPAADPKPDPEPEVIAPAPEPKPAIEDPAPVKPRPRTPRPRVPATTRVAPIKVPSPRPQPRQPQPQPQAPAPQEPQRAPTQIPTPTPQMVQLPFATGQIWSGSYTCMQGKSSLFLRINAVRGLDVDAEFTFSSAVDGANGSYSMSGRYNPASHGLTLQPRSWTRRPAGYEMVGISGVVSSSGAQFAGSVMNPACRTFSVRR